MALYDLIDQAITRNTRNGVIDHSRTRKTASMLVRNDDDAISEAIEFAVTKLIHDRATRAMRQTTKGGSDQRQASFFGDNLREFYACDNEQKVIKNVKLLTRMEFKRILTLREKQVSDDMKHLEAMRIAYREFEPIWDQYPDKLFGEVEKIYLERESAA